MKKVNNLHAVNLRDINKQQKQRPHQPKPKGVFFTGLVEETLPSAKTA
jgi:hypothetical protein